MSATNPEEEKNKPIGLTNKVLFVDYAPTQYLLDVLDTTETPMFKDGEGYYRPHGNLGPTGAPKVNKKADLFRFHTGKYYKQFPVDSVYNAAVGQKDILNKHKSIDGPGKTTAFTGYAGSEVPSDWQPYSGKEIAGSKTELAIQHDITDYTLERNFSPVTVAITKFQSSEISETSNKQQYILISHKEDPDKAPNAQLKFEFTDIGWLEYISNIADSDSVRINKFNFSEERIFTDHPFVYNFPINNADSSGGSSFFKTLFANIETDYSYYMKEYEDALAATDANVEQYLPNIYIFSDLFGKKNLDFLGGKNNKDYKDLIELDGFADPSFWYEQGSISGQNDVVDTLSQEDIWAQVTGNTSSDAAEDQDSKTSQSAFNGPKSASSSFNGYLKKWSKLFTIGINDFLTGLSAAGANTPPVFITGRNLIIPPFRNNILGEVEKKKALFPMHTKIEFSTDKNVEFGDLLLKANLWDNLLSEIVNITDGKESDFESTIRMKGFPEQQVISIQDGQTSSPQAQTITSDSFVSTNARVFDLKAWLDSGQANFKSVDGNAVVLDLDLGTSEGASGYDYNTLFNMLSLKALKTKLNTLQDKYHRNFQDILDGKTCYNETIFYRVAKIDSATSEVVQNFYFVNTADTDIINYIDTQVFYGKKYQYKIYAWQLVLGNKYEYKNTYFSTSEDVPVEIGKDSLPDSAQFGTPASWAVVDTRIYNSAVLMEVPYYTPSPLRVIDDPPVPPEVELIPYKNIGDKILMFLRSNTGEYKLTPRPIEEEDEETLEILREAKGYGVDDKVKYATDDHITKYEIFRTTTLPKSYKDFIGKRIVTIENETSFVDDTIKPNTKYYYIFRSIDNHGFISNPTEVYELEMMQNLDSVYPIINVVSIESYEEEHLTKSKTETKNVRKYLYIKPTLTQAELNYENVENLFETETASEITPRLGFEDEGVIGKKFKIRLTSKKTGKRMDFNLDFRTSYDKTKIVKKQ